MAPEAGSQLPRVRLGRLVQPEGDARPGIALLPDSRRIYPQGALAGQVIGTVGIETRG